MQWPSFFLKNEVLCARYISKCKTHFHVDLTEHISLAISLAGISLLAVASEFRLTTAGGGSPLS